MYSNNLSSMSRAFTLLEILLIFAITAILIAMTVPALRLFTQSSDVDRVTENVANTLRLARNNTTASDEDARYGIYLDTAASPQEYTLFQGDSYGSRNTAKDEIFSVPDTTVIDSVALATGGAEIVFDRVSGNTANTGEITLHSSSDTTRTRTISIDGNGRIETRSTGNPSDDNRVKDSRHVHITYTRAIDTATESMFLDFPVDGTREEIVIADHMSGGQLDWEGEVEVDGETQVLVVKTHALNDASLDTIFSIHRDQRYNSKAVEVNISGDSASSPDIIRYEASGDTTQGNSLDVSAPVWQ